MKKWVQIVLPVMLFATVLYFCVFAVVFYQSEQTAALLGSGMTVVLDAGHGGEDGGATGDPGDGYRRLFRRLPHDRREKGLGHQKPCEHSQPDRAAAAAQHPSELFYRGQIPWRAGLLRQNARQPTARGAAAEQSRPRAGAGQSPAVQKIRRRVPDGAYRLHGCAGRVRIFVQLR